MKTYKLFTIMIALACAVQVFAYDFKVGQIYYLILGGDSVAITYGSSNPWYNSNGEYTGSITIPEAVRYEGTTYRVTNIGLCAFCSCSNLTAVTIPNSVTAIGPRAFMSCYRLTTVTIPNSITTISGEAFSGCSNLTTFTMPNYVTTIGVYAFKNCSNLSTITIPSSVTSVSAGAFDGCSKLTYNIHENIKYLGNDENPYHALIENTDKTITSCPIHENTKVIGSLAFKDCTQLTTVTIPNGVITIGAEVFSGCSNLTAITIPKSVITIGLSAFYECSNLTAINIPNSVTTIDDYAFFGCSGLTAITCEAVTPPTIDKKTFDGVDKNIPLYVPAESVEAYKAAEYWKEFTNIQGIANVDGLDDVIGNDSNKTTRKVFEDGVIYMLRDGEKYTIDGQKVE